MVDRAGRVVYVGKARRLRARLMSYFRAGARAEKTGRIIEASDDVQWDYTPSDFSASLRELREIRRYRPPFNVRMNRTRRVAFVKVSAGPASRVYVGRTITTDDSRHYGPYQSAARVTEGVRVLNDMLGLRDCALDAGIAWAEQGDLFQGARRAGCMRHSLGTCTGPCAGFVTEPAYAERLEQALAFLEGRGVAPLDRVVSEMTAASTASAFEMAARWRDRFDALEWLFAAGNAARAAVDALSFVYVDPGVYGDTRAWVIKRATVRGSAPAPTTPIEREAFRALVAEHAGDEHGAGSLPVEAIDEMLLLLSWFRRHPAALRRTVPLDQWLDGKNPC